MDLAQATRYLSAAQIRSIADAQARINVWSGAIRSGKTIASLLRWLMYVAAAPPGELVVVAKTSQTAMRNVFAPLQDYALYGELASHTHYTAGASSATILGRRVWVIGANDVRSETRLRGLTCAGAYVDEATLVPQQFWTQLLGRMSVPGAQLFATTNPDNPAHWLRRDFILRQGQLDLRHWHFTLDDNPVLGDAYKKAIKAEFVGLWFRRMVLGEWVAAEGSVYDMWDPDVHIVDIVPPIVHWIGAGIDYGTTNPFAALLLGLGADGCLYLTSEYRYDSRQSHRQLTDAEYSQRFQQWLREVPIPASRRTDGTWLRGVKPDYVVVDPSAASFRVQLHNDGVTNIAADNEVLDGIRVFSSLLAGRRLFVHRSCEGLIAEIPGYAWDDSARLRGEDKPLKVDDHSCFVASTPVLTDVGWRPIETVSAGDHVMTRQGWKPVIRSGLTKSAASTVCVTLSNGEVLEGTGNHPVWVAGHGWTRMDSLRYGDKLEAWQMSSSSKESGTADTLMRRMRQNATTTFRESLTGKSMAWADFTRRSGRTPTGRFQRVATSTIAITTRSIIRLRTWSVSRTKPIGPTTPTIGAVAAPRRSRRIWNRSGSLLQSGTGPMRVELGTSSTASGSGKTGSLRGRRASSAAQGTRRSAAMAGNGSALTGASRHSAEQRALTTSSECVTSVALRSGSTSTQRRAIAPVHVLAVVVGHQQVPVLNLTVADCPEYCAAGVLVHNCDGARYVIKTTRSLWHDRMNLAA